MSEYCNNCNGTGYVRDGYDGEKPCPWCNEPEETTLRDEEAERNPQPVSAQLEPASPEGDAAYWRARAERAEAANRWIPVSERLPENGKRVLVLTDAGYVVGAFHMWFKQWTTDEGIYFHTGMYDSITHWMPLPEPPAHDAGKDGDA